MSMASSLDIAMILNEHTRPSPTAIFNAMILMIIARRAMKHFFLTIYFYAPSHPPFNFFFFQLLFNAKRHSKAKTLKVSETPFTRGIGGCVT
jgi:hypothetical protein